MEKLWAVLAGWMLLVACSHNAADSVKLVQSSQTRQSEAQLLALDVTQLSKGSREFAFDTYRALKSKPGNFLVSPYSLSMALTMTYAGAQGQTATEMAQTLHLPAQSDVHAASNKLGYSISSSGQVWIANSLFVDEKFKPYLKSPYLDILAVNYGAGVNVLDFLNNPEGARQSINSWVSDKTQSKIKDLIPAGSLTADTALVLTNAVYLKAAWADPFDADDTYDDDFHLASGDVQVSMMHDLSTRRYMENSVLQAIELPYEGQRLSMVVILPKGDLAALENMLDTAQFDAVVGAFSNANVRLSLPKFTFDYGLSAKELLIFLGMPAAFNAAFADFSALVQKPGNPLYIGDVHHKAFIKMTEKGTEAAAATAVAVGATGALPPSNPQPIVEMLVNKPFIFAIRDMNSGTLLFLGRVQDPR